MSSQLHDPAVARGSTDHRTAAPAAHQEGRPAIRSTGPWVWLSFAAAVLAAAGSLVGLLLADQIYGQETPTLADAAAAQDTVNLALVAPVLIVLGYWASHGSLRAYLVWLGFLAFTAYNYAIYAFAVQFGPLFLLWVAVLGLSVFALAGGLSNLDASAVKSRFTGRALPLTARVLIVVATLFALLWLSEIVPDLLVGDTSRSASEWNVPTNPVHVLDLAIFLPAVAASGVLLLRNHPAGYSTAPGQLVFLALTCLPILLTPVIANARGHEAGWTVLLPVGILLVGTLATLWWTLRGVSEESRARS